MVLIAVAHRRPVVLTDRRPLAKVLITVAALASGSASVSVTHVLLGPRGVDTRIIIMLIKRSAHTYTGVSMHACTHVPA
jgi:hypothetical protein